MRWAMLVAIAGLAGEAEANELPPPDDAAEEQIDWTQAAIVGGGTAAGYVAGNCVALLGTGCWPLALAWPLVHAYVTTWVSDAYGTHRSAAIWPILASYGSIVGAGALVLGLGLVGLSVGAVIGVAIGGVLALFDPARSGDLIGSGAGSGSGYGFLAGALVGWPAGIALVAVAPGLAYWFAMEPKLPDDRGEGTPGILVPSTGQTDRRAPRRTAMVY